MFEIIQRGPGAPGCQTRASAPPPLGANHCDPPIQRLPPEILVEVIQNSTQPDTRLRDLVRLTLVCQRWSIIIHDSPVLWARINAAEGSSVVRKALETAKDALIDLTFNYNTAQMKLRAFFESIVGRIGHWRTLDVLLQSPKWDFILEHLEKGTPPNLEALHLSAGFGQWSRSKALFGGNPAPPGLKEISLVNIPIQVAPLRLSGLKSLTIGKTMMISATDVLNVILGSPAIESIRLRYLEALGSVPPSHQVFSLPDAFGNPSIQLTSLVHLSLVNISMSFLSFLLSTITAPRLQTLEIDCDLQETSIPQLLGGLQHQLATLAKLTAHAQMCKVGLSYNACYGITIGGLDLTFFMEDLPLDTSEETWDWVCNHLGRSLKDLPAYLEVIDWEPEIPNRLKWFTCRLTVTKLRLHSDPYFGTALERIVPFLSRPTTTTPVTWLFPQVEIIETNLVWEDGNADIVEMIRNRHSAEDGKDGTVAPKPFQEIWLSFGGKAYSKLPPPNMEFLQEVRRVAKAADIYWEKEKLS
ncbi:hypothetical protein M407DRAFT_234641 [Tulasnella calospora MUT 4182]|uniref:F-box domain-containing protein n=1 Tax=Tulasnella calospora MUT 4182 TaxID=1051891 RepID=A0A0C3Q9F3_9AGAM|nr:hypothetical protein M407DRAFT_234641 [Tulasnella calospora MUT 4182]